MYFILWQKDPRNILILIPPFYAVSDDFKIACTDVLNGVWLLWENVLHCYNLM